MTYLVTKWLRKATRDSKVSGGSYYSYEKALRKVILTLKGIFIAGKT